MRKVFYGTLLVYLLASLLAFSAAPALAQTTSNQLTQKTATTIEHQAPSANSGNMGFSGEAKAGASSPNMSNSLINCQRALLGEYCALPQWELGIGKFSPGRDELNSGPVF